MMEFRALLTDAMKAFQGIILVAACSIPLHVLAFLIQTAMTIIPALMTDALLILHAKTQIIIQIPAMMGCIAL